MGHDPFDALLSPLALPLRRLRWPAVAWIQLRRRSSMELATVLAIPPHLNPKSLSLTLQGLLAWRHSGRASPGVDPVVLTERLQSLQTRSGGWGYPFPWANRHFLAPAGTPSSVVTAFVGGSLLDARSAGLDVAGTDDALRRAARFVVSDLRRIPTPGGFLFSYTPLDDRAVHNSSLLAAEFLARVHSEVEPSDEWAESARAAARATLSAQRPDGSWPYGRSRRDSFVDSFHTGYILRSLRRLDALGVVEAGSAVQRGFDYWWETFANGTGIPHRPHVPYPVDFHAVAEAMLTLLAFRDVRPEASARAVELAWWAVERGRGRDGAFDYLWHPTRPNKTRYLRWVQAWMFRGLATLVSTVDARLIAPSHAD